MLKIQITVFFYMLIHTFFYVFKQSLRFDHLFFHKRKTETISIQLDIFQFESIHRSCSIRFSLCPVLNFRRSLYRYNICHICMNILYVYVYNWIKYCNPTQIRQLYIYVLLYMTNHNSHVAILSKSFLVFTDETIDTEV